MRCIETTSDPNSPTPAALQRWHASSSSPPRDPSELKALTSASAGHDRLVLGHDGAHSAGRWNRRGNRTFSRMRRPRSRAADGRHPQTPVNSTGRLEISREASMYKRVAMTVWISALMAGWLFWTGPGVAAAAPKGYVGLFKDDAVAVIDTAENKVVGTIPVPKGP